MNGCQDQSGDKVENGKLRCSKAPNRSAAKQRSHTLDTFLIVTMGPVGRGMGTRKRRGEGICTACGVATIESRVKTEHNFWRGCAHSGQKHESTANPERLHTHSAVCFIHRDIWTMAVPYRSIVYN